MERQSYVVAQLGARMHYAVPRILFARQSLECFHTDAVVPKFARPLIEGLGQIGLRPSYAGRLLARDPAGVPRSHIRAANIFGLEYAWRLSRAVSQEERVATYLWAGERFSRLVVEAGFGNATGVYTFNTAGLEIMEAAKRKGLRTVMEQTIAPYEVECRLLDEERQKFPEWEPYRPTGQVERQYAQRERQEWELADLILCGSEFVRESIRQIGGPVEKCRVVPYGVDSRFSLPPRVAHGGPLRVLTVGAVGLRKGSPYVLEAAKQLKGEAVFRMVGPVGVSRKVRAELEEHVELTGPVPNSEIMSHYAWADVFLLPSICEGSATAIYEALASSLPVICTPNAGSVVEDGRSGFLVRAGDADEIVPGLKRTGELKPLGASEMQAFGIEQYRLRILSALDLSQ